jgi:hypothetical protein
VNCEHELELARGEIARLTEDISNLEREHKLHLRREQHGKAVLARYNARFGRKLRWIPDGQNAKLIARAIRCYDTHEEGLQACLEAMDGLACRPYVVKEGGFLKRSPTGTERQRHDKPYHALGGKDPKEVNDFDIERFRKYAREAREEGLGIPQWGPVVSAAYLDQAVAENVALRQVVEILRDWCSVTNEYVVLLEEKAGATVEQLAIAA